MLPNVRRPAESVLAVDIGGTFTDAALTTPDAVYTAKVPTTPTNPVDGFVAAARQVIAVAGIATSAVSRVVHATTLATNAILERRGAPVALVTTVGYRSLLALGRHARVEEERYDLWSVPTPPIVPLTHTFEVPERVLADGAVLVPLSDAEGNRVANEIAALDVAGVAICLLNSYANNTHEKRMAALCRSALGPQIPVICSWDISPEMREFERMTTTVMSAYVGPLMKRYLSSLEQALSGIGVTAQVFVMDSAGGVMPAELAADLPAHTIESGPAAGVLAAAQIGGDEGCSDVVSFDMGGTTAKAALVRGGLPEVTHDFTVGGKGSFGGRRAGSGVPIRIPAIDLAEVGSGGGSIAWIDAAGGLRVGPQSAGAVPGPVCYRRGGTAPTVTDVNLVLGYLSSETFAAGSMTLDREAAVAAVDQAIASPLGVSVHEAAFAVHEIANANMAAAIHVVTVQRGVDPRRFALVSTGGAAAMHACRIADRFDIGQVIVPANAGVGSCVGLLHTDLVRERSRTSLMDLAQADPAEIEKLFAELADAAAADLAVSSSFVDVRRSVAMRFVGQAHELAVAVKSGPISAESLVELEQRFYDCYREAYGINVTGPIELVTFRAEVRLIVEERQPFGRRNVVSAGLVATHRDAWFPEVGGTVRTPVLPRHSLVNDDILEGPLIIEDSDSTLVVAPGWSVASRGGALRLTHPSGATG